MKPPLYMFIANWKHAAWRLENLPAPIQMHGSNSTAPPMGCGHSLHPSTELEGDISEGEMCDDVKGVTIITFSDMILYFYVSALFYIWDCPNQTYDMIHCCS